MIDQALYAEPRNGQILHSLQVVVPYSVIHIAKKQITVITFSIVLLIARVIMCTLTIVSTIQTLPCTSSKKIPKILNFRQVTHALVLGRSIEITRTKITKHPLPCSNAMRDVKLMRIVSTLPSEFLDGKRVSAIRKKRHKPAKEMENSSWKTRTLNSIQPILLMED
jgi:hypothetical protein